jgi:ParB family chromosome partitioning protein
VLQPITVRPDLDGRFMIVAGERRWRAHQLAGLPTIEANPVAVSDDELAIAAIVENLQRQDITPLEEAFAFRRMIDEGYSVESLALRLGLKQPHRISDRLQLLRLAPDYLDLFRKGHLHPSQAFELSRLDRAGQTALFAMLQAGRCESYARLRAAADGILAAAAQIALFDLPPPPTDEEVATLSKFERMVEKLTAICNDGIKENEVVVLRKVNPDRAATVVLVAQVDVAILRADDGRGDQHALQEAVRIAFEVVAVLEGPRLAFVDVDGEEARRGFGADDVPLAARRKTGAAQSAQQQLAGWRLQAGHHHQ